MEREKPDMDESLTLAQLTLMLLRASVQPPDSLPRDYGIIILPSHVVVTREEALRRLSGISGDLQVSGEIEGRNLVVSVREPIPHERRELEVTAENFVQTIRQQNTQGDPNALVRAVGLGEQVIVPAKVLERWLWRTNCWDCSMGVGLPGPKDPPAVVAVLYLGRRR